MDGIGFGRLAFLITAMVMALMSACSWSLADSSPRPLHFCAVGTSSDEASETGEPAQAEEGDTEYADANCVPRLTEGCPDTAVEPGAEAPDNRNCAP